MDVTAINAIRDLANAELTNRLLEKNIVNNLANIVALPKDYQIADLEIYQATPNHFEATFKTSLIQEFIGYVNANGGENSSVFVNAEKESAQAIFDLGNQESPEWGLHKARLQLKKTAEFLGLVNNSTKKLSQLDLVAFAEDFSENITFYQGCDKELTLLSNALQAIRKMTVSSKSDKDSDIGDFKSATNKFDEIEVKSKGNELPAGFIFACSPYEGFSGIKIDCKLRAIVEGDKIYLCYRLVGVEQLMEKIGLEFKEILQDCIKTKGISFHCGDMDYRNAK